MRNETIKKSLVTTTALALGMALPIGVAYAAPGTASATITVDGQQVAPINGKISCAHEYTGFVIQAGHDRGSAYVQIGHTPAMDGLPLKIDKARITQTDGAEYSYDDTIQGNAGDVHYQGPPDPVSHQSGNYKITGHLRKTRNGGESDGGFVQNGPLVPFEIDATCS